jgi:hypothetical protein
MHLRASSSLSLEKGEVTMHASKQTSALTVDRTTIRLILLPGDLMAISLVEIA